tara:strand:+ start:3311 stop:4066 length:756 start_codon:yes stop_codon:yes gene_type:complete
MDKRKERGRINITEVEPEEPHRLVISKSVMNCDEIDESIPQPLPRNSFFWIIVGKSGSGKTNLLISLLTKNNKFFNKRFDRVYMVSPSVDTIVDNPFDTLPEEQKFSELSKGNLNKILTEVEGSGENCLLVLDDCLADMKDKKLEKQLTKLSFNRRHLCGKGGRLSIIATAQVYNRIPLQIRKNASHLALFKSQNKKEIESLFSEVILIPYDSFIYLMDYVYRQKYNFLYIDTTASANNMFYKNFNRLELN